MSAREPASTSHQLSIIKTETLRVSSAGDCARCLSIYQKHDNVLQYKESKCMMDHMRSYEDLCWSISVDEPLKTLFRVNGKPSHIVYIEAYM